MTIKLQNLNKSYGKKPILRDVNLEIPTGNFTMLRGVSGSGKSTLLSIIAGLEPATSGKVLIDDQDVNELKGKARTEFYRHKIGFIFQGFYLQPQLTIGENIALMGTFAGMPKKERSARVLELAQLLGIDGVLKQLPSEVSGGQAERACAARAMFMHPDIILADEPTNNLDPDNARNVIEMLKQVQESMGATMIVASHDSLVEQYASQIIYIKEGRVTDETWRTPSGNSASQSDAQTEPISQNDPSVDDVTASQPDTQSDPAPQPDTQPEPAAATPGGV